MDSQGMPFCFYILNIQDIYAVAMLSSCLITGQENPLDQKSPINSTSVL